MGILLEADYKGVVSGKESPIAGLRRAFSATKAGTQNPLERREDEPLRPQESDGQLTYEVMNRDSGMFFFTHCLLYQFIPGNCPTNCTNNSCMPRQRVFAQIRPHVPIHLRRSRDPPLARTLHNDKARRRIHNQHHIPQHALHLHPCALHV